MVVELDEIRRTVLRMEAALQESDAVVVRQLMEAYAALLPRFASDLADERDEFLTRGGALMLVQEALKRQAPE